MYYIALRMLMGDTTKYLALVFGLTFSTTLVVQQGSIFTGLLRRTAASIETVPQADIWVMHPATRHYEERKPIEDTAALRVRGIDGVDWAERLYVGNGSAQLPDGTYAALQIVGVERRSKVGLPMPLDIGNSDDIDESDAVFWDNVGIATYAKVKAGDVLQINDRRARVVGEVTAPRTFTSNPTVYTVYERALEYSPGERNRLTFVLVHVKPGYDVQKVAAAIREKTGLGAKTADEFFWSTVWFFIKSTGITINFGITVMLGLIVGIAIAGQTFYTFTVENTKHFGALKAMGASNGTLIKMVLLQAFLVGLIGWGLGAGLASLFGMRITSRSLVAFLLTPHLLTLSFGIMIITVLLAALVSIYRVLRIEPAIVFR
ncbi:MAG TPA: ABC transporter permease [Planctomycetota bacterium]|nr:ABC transporter permease [Planctomycetota bacterium]